MCLRLGSAFDGNMFLLFNGCCILFGNGKLQNTVFKFGFDLILRDAVADVKTPAHGASVTFPADIVAFLILFMFIKSL